MFAATFETTGEGFDLLMNNLVGAYVAALGESFATGFAGVWSFPSMTAFMCLDEVSMRRCTDCGSSTFRLPSCEKRWPHEGSLQSWEHFVNANNRSVDVKATHEWLMSGMCANMDLEMGFLKEYFGA